MDEGAESDEKYYKIKQYDLKVNRNPMPINTRQEAIVLYHSGAEGNRD